MPSPGLDPQIFRSARTTDRSVGERAIRRTRRAETFYGRQLRRLAKMVGDIVRGSAPETREGQDAIISALRAYGDSIRPWAQSVGQRMIAETEAASWKAWVSLSREMGRALRYEVEKGATGQVMRERLSDQVDLIQSIPREAAQRVQRLATEGMIQGTRASEIAKRIMETEGVTTSRANLIAITEVGRTATALAEARALSIGSPGYIWETVEDEAVRHSHKEMNGKFVAWDAPPTLDGLTGHAGALPRCRCVPSVVMAGERFRTGV